MPTDDHQNEALRDLSSRLGRIEGKIDAVLDLEPRVSSLERWRSFLTGAWAVLAAGVGYIVRGAA